MYPQVSGIIGAGILKSWFWWGPVPYRSCKSHLFIYKKVVSLELINGRDMYYVNTERHGFVHCLARASTQWMLLWSRNLLSQSCAERGIHDFLNHWGIDKSVFYTFIYTKVRSPTKYLWETTSSVTCGPLIVKYLICLTRYQEWNNSEYEAVSVLKIQTDVDTLPDKTILHCSKWQDGSYENMERAHGPS